MTPLAIPLSLFSETTMSFDGIIASCISNPLLSSTLFKGELMHFQGSLISTRNFQIPFPNKETPNPASSGRIPKFGPCLIQGDVGDVREVQCGHKQVDVVTVQTTLVNILCDDLADKIFAGACPPV